MVHALKPMLIVLIVAGLSACGNKGPLYLPDEPRNTVSALQDEKPVNPELTAYGSF